jgi:hypothetical protein
VKEEKRQKIPDLGSTTFLVVIDNNNVCNIISAARLEFAWKKWTSITKIYDLKQGIQIMFCHLKSSRYKLGFNILSCPEKKLIF